MKVKDHQPFKYVQLWHFFLHLRWHYQLFILSGGFLLGGFLSNTMNWWWFLIQFANVHLLLFGGATAYNSYWDKDKGSVGGLKNPPKMSHWMWPASLFLQMAGLMVAMPMGNAFLACYLFSMLLFWLYSSPVFRWKGRPILSLIAIGISTGTNSVILGYFAAATPSSVLETTVLVAAVGTAFTLLSLYPLSQIYQLDEDRERGDRTFALAYGKETVFLFYKISFGLGLLLISGSIITLHTLAGILFLVVGSLVGMGVWKMMKYVGSDKEDYSKVMHIKYGTSFAFVAFLIAALLLKHST